MKRKFQYHLHQDEREEMRVLGGVVYMMKSRGLRTEP